MLSILSRPQCVMLFFSTDNSPLICNPPVKCRDPCENATCPAYPKNTICRWVQWNQQSDTRLDDFLTHWDQVTHICVGKLTIIGSDNSLSPGQRQAIVWTNAGILLIEPLGTNFSEYWPKFLHFHSRKCISTFRYLKVFLKFIPNYPPQSWWKPMSIQ